MLDNKVHAQLAIVLQAWLNPRPFELHRTHKVVQTGLNRTRTKRQEDAAVHANLRALWMIFQKSKQQLDFVAVERFKESVQLEAPGAKLLDSFSS